DDVDPGQSIVQVDRVPIGIQVHGRHIRIGMVPGGVDDDAVDKDVSLTITGQLVGLGVVTVETVCRIGVEKRIDVLDDHRLGVNPAGADIVEDPAVLPFVVLLGVGIVAPGGAVVRNVESSGGIAGDDCVAVLARSVGGRVRRRSHTGD